MSTALVLEGGAMRGMFTCGVIDVFMENGIDFDACVGVSAGAVFGCNYKSRQIGRGIRYNKKYCRDPRYGTIRSLIRTGDIYDADLCYRQIPDVLDPFDRDAIKKNPMRFYIGATDIVTGQTVFHECIDGEGTDIDWFRASASLPLVSKAVIIGERTLLDGGITDPIPYRFMEKKGYDKIVIVLTQHRGYRKKKSAMQPIINGTMRKYPRLIEAMKRRHLVYNAQLREVARREADGRALVIRPPVPVGISRTEHDPMELERVYRMGRTEGLKRLEDVKEYLGNMLK